MCGVGRLGYVSSPSTTGRHSIRLWVPSCAGQDPTADSSKSSTVLRGTTGRANRVVDGAAASKLGARLAVLAFWPSHPTQPSTTTAAIDHQATHRTVAIERAFTRALGGNCHSPVAALAQIVADGVRLRAEILSGDGAERIAEDRIVRDEDEAAAMAREMLGRASAALRELFE